MGDPRMFSLHEGGPFYRLMRRVHLVRPSGRIRGIVLALCAWLPPVIGEGIRRARGVALDPTLLDISVHVRLLVALPAMLFSELLVERACASTIKSLYAGGFCEPSALDAVVERGERLRDARWPELTLLAIAVIGGQLALWRISGASGVFHGDTGAWSWSFPHLWYVLVALPLVQFVMLRWLWRWTIWAFMLAQIARLSLSLVPTHPDHAGGLGCLARPVSGFCGFVAATGAVLAGAWGTQLIGEHTTVKALLPELVVFLLAALAAAVAPLLLFCGHLYRERRRALAQYGDFAVEYGRGFHARWIESSATGEQALGSSDIQSLSDLAGAYGVISQMRLFVFGIRSVIAVWSAALLPMAPLFARMMTLEHVFSRILKTVFSGIPV